MLENFSVEEIYKSTPLHDSLSRRFWMQRKQKKIKNYKKRKNKKKKTHHIDIYV